MNIAMKELLRRPSRLVSVGGALTLLVVLLVVLGGFLDGLELNQTGAYRAHEERLIAYSSNSERLAQRSSLDQTQAEQLAAVDGVAAVGALSYVGSTATISANEIVDIVLFGYDLATEVLPAPPADGGAVIDEALADQNGVDVGDTLLLGSTSEPVVVAAIVGDLSQGSPTVWLSTQRWREVLAVANPAALPPEGTSLLMIIEPAAGIGIGQLAINLDGIDVATVDDAVSALPVVQQQSSSFQGIIGVTFVVTLLVVALFFALITMERVALYAVLKALGARSRDLLTGISLQAVCVSLVAVAIGFTISVIFVSLLPADLPVRLVPTRMAQIAAGVVLTSLVGSLFTLRRILSIDPAKAIG